MLASAIAIDKDDRDAIAERHVVQDRRINLDGPATMPGAAPA